MTNFLMRYGWSILGHGGIGTLTAGVYLAFGLPPALITLGALWLLLALLGAAAVSSRGPREGKR